MHAFQALHQHAHARSALRDSRSCRLERTCSALPLCAALCVCQCVVSDSLLKLDPAGSGTVTWTRHQSCTFYTPFDLQQFPFDSQSFPMQRLSFFYNSSELSLVYSPLGCFQPDPRLDYVNSLWDLTDFDCELLSYNGKQDEAQAVLYVSRRWQAYVLKMIVPMFLIVIVSSFSYFVDPAAAPARVGLSVAIVLTVSTFNLLVSQDLPKSGPAQCDRVEFHTIAAEPSPSFTIALFADHCVVASVLSRVIVTVPDRRRRPSRCATIGC